MSKEKSKQNNYTSNNGITLIALIITIVVMLILVAVTLDIAIGDNGLVNKAKTAGEATTREIERETLLTAAIGAMDNNGTVNFTELDSNLPEGFTGSNGNYTSKNGNTFTVSANGNITYAGENSGNNGDNPLAFSWEDVGLTVDTNTEYSDGYFSLIFSTDGILTVFRQGMEFLVIDATDSKNVNDGKIDFIGEIEGEERGIKLQMNANNTGIDLVRTYYYEEDGVTETETITTPCVKVVLDSVEGKRNAYSNAEVLQALGATGGTYKGTWTVIERDASGKPTKLVSTSDVTSCTLGYEDPNAVGADDFEKSIWSYQNAVASLNTAAQEATGIQSAESIKLEDIEALATIDKGTDYNKEYLYNYTNNNNQTFVNEEGQKVVLDSAGKEITLKHTYFSYTLTEDEIGILTQGYYWLASPCVVCFSDYARFGVRCVGSGNIYFNTVFFSNGTAGNISSGVRAVVSVSGL